jgi:hypothetical protein
MKSERISPFWVGGYRPFSAHKHKGWFSPGDNSDHPRYESIFLEYHRTKLFFLSNQGISSLFSFPYL